MAARPHVSQFVAQLGVPDQRRKVLDRDRHPDVIDWGVAHRLDRPVGAGGAAKQPDIAGPGLVQRPLKRDRAFFHPRRLRQTRRMRGIWKWVGLAGVAGVVAGGVLVARDQRKRNSYTPEDIRARLHQRVAEAGDATT
jgi:hypothetical protein